MPCAILRPVSVRRFLRVSIFDFWQRWTPNNRDPRRTKTAIGHMTEGTKAVRHLERNQQNVLKGNVVISEKIGDFQFISVQISNEQMILTLRYCL